MLQFFVSFTPFSPLVREIITKEDNCDKKATEREIRESKAAGLALLLFLPFTVHQKVFRKVLEYETFWV